MTKPGGGRLPVKRTLMTGWWLLGLAGCASGPPPDPQLAAADVAVKQASDAGAPARAAGPYALASDKLERARQAAAAGDNVEARRLAEEALVDAQLAEAQARSDVARANAAELRATVESLREEVAKHPPSTS
jgi:Domain of unknown function (DUF4398)